MSEDSICPICMGTEMTNFVTSCNHHFHNECLFRWCSQNNSCPICRSQNIMDLNVCILATPNQESAPPVSNAGNNEILIDMFNYILDHSGDNNNNNNDNTNETSIYYENNDHMVIY